MGNFSCESREQNRKDKVTGLRSVTYVRQQGLLVNTLGSHLKEAHTREVKLRVDVKRQTRICTT